MNEKRERKGTEKLKRKRRINSESGFRDVNLASARLGGCVHRLLSPLQLASLAVTAVTHKVVFEHF